MAKPRPEKPAEHVLPMSPKLGDRLGDDERREGRPRTRQASRQREVTMIPWSAHERVAVKRGKEGG
jgi:hypothetical protein